MAYYGIAMLLPVPKSSSLFLTPQNSMAPDFSAAPARSATDSRPRDLVFVVNPKGANGRTGKDWKNLLPYLRSRLGNDCNISESFTSGPCHAIDITREAIRQGADAVIAVGGDGTLHEVTNGFFWGGKPVSCEDPEVSHTTALGLIPLGTGSDFARTLNWKNNPEDAIERIAKGQRSRIDIGVIRGEDGEYHYFNNVADIHLTAKAGYYASKYKRFGNLCYVIADPLRPLINIQFHVNSTSNLRYIHNYTLIRHRITQFNEKPISFLSCARINPYGQSRVPKNSHKLDLLALFLKNQSTRIRAKSKNSHETDSSTEQKEKNSSETKKTPSSGHGSGSGSKKGGWWGKSGKWRWQPIIQAQEIGILLLQLGIVIFVMRLLRPGIPLPGSDPRPSTTLISVPYSDFLSKVNGNCVKKVEVDGVHIMFKLKDVVESGNEEDVVESGSKLAESELLLRSVTPTKRVVYTTTRPNDIKTPYEKMVENEVEFGSPDKRSGGFLNSALISLFYVAVLAGLLQRFPFSWSQHTTGQLRNRKSGSSNIAKETEHGESVTFADVAGVDEAKEELEEIVEFLKNPERYIRVGARPPRGVLLVGLPGTGKTLLAKAVAGEADVPFISCSASEFVELYVGMGASRVRDLFARAKKEAPSIIFIDEIDAVAKSRDGKFRIVSNDEREQTLNQLLTEMDGFDSNSAVIVLGATNRSDVLDPALRRPGRFDRVVMVETPDKIGREAILNVHVSKKELPLGEDVDLVNIASMTTGFTGADLANLVNEAALLAGRQNKTVVEKIDFIHAVERAIAGIEKKTAKLQGCEKGVVARHEAGHAVVGTAIANLIPGQPRVSKLSILPRSGGALGFTYTPPTTEDRYLLFVDELRGRLVTLLGGRAAEEVVYSGRVSTGAVDDIRRATDMAYKAVTEYGLNQTIGPVSLSTLSSGVADDASGASPWGRGQGHLDDLAQIEVKELLQSALEIALCVVRANPTVLEGLGADLEEKEKVEGEELHKWLKMVVAPAELAFFITGKQESILPLQTNPGQRLFDVQ